MSYLLDANVFIQAKSLHYGLDFCPAFWQWLIDGHADGRVFSIDKVADEIAAGADELTQWMHDHGNGLFRKTDAAVAAQFGKVSTWVTGQQYEPAAINTFLQVADFYLVAHALAGGWRRICATMRSDARPQRPRRRPCSGPPDPRGQWLAPRSRR